MKKTIILALILTGFLLFLGPNLFKVSAITEEELQAQIQQLLQIIQQLQQQLNILIQQNLSSKKVTIVSPQGGATITSSSLPISWTLEGFTGNEGKVRILFYGGGEATSTTGWQLVRDNLPLSSGSYTLDLTTVSISDPSRCKLRIGVYNPSTNNWVTWSQGSYTGQYYVDTSFSVQFITSSASTPTSCTWCGQSCVRKTANMYCVQVMPPEGAECREINGVCQIVYGATSYLDSLKIQLPQLSDLIKKLSAALVQLGQKSQ